jgi:hypothetical protein
MSVQGIEETLAVAPRLSMAFPCFPQNCACTVLNEESLLFTLIKMFNGKLNKCWYKIR